MISKMKYLYYLSLLIWVLPSYHSNAQNMIEKPNIVIILADDMGFSDISFYGGDKIQTPNLDLLSKTGVNFTRFYNNAWCSPSRASLLTGRYPQEVGMGRLANANIGPSGPYQGFLSENSITLAELLKNEGYSTLMSGKWHLGELPQFWPTKRGFDRYFGLISGAANYFDITKTKIDTSISKAKLVRYMALDDQRYYPPQEGFYMTQAITDQALNMLEGQKDKDDPFFLYLAYTAPHWPLHALPEDIEKYKGKFDNGWDDLQKKRFANQKKAGLFAHENNPLRDPQNVAWDSLSKQEQKEMAEKMEVYAAQIDRMDQGIGEVMKKIEELGQIDNTIFIFLSDNGASAEDSEFGMDSRKNGLPPGSVDSYMSYGRAWANVSNTPYRKYKTWLNEGGIITPFIVRWPNVIPQQMEGKFIKQEGSQATHMIDIMATVIDILNIDTPKADLQKDAETIPGESFLPLLLDKNTEWSRKQPLFWALNGHRAVLFKDYKLISEAADSTWQLYNIKNDQLELQDISHKEPERVRMMSEMWQNWALKVGVFDTEDAVWKNKNGE